MLHSARLCGSSCLVKDFYPVVLCASFLVCAALWRTNQKTKEDEWTGGH